MKKSSLAVSADGAKKGFRIGWETPGFDIVSYQSADELIGAGFEADSQQPYFWGSPKSIASGGTTMALKSVKDSFPDKEKRRQENG
jgi:hypothetical protein